MLSSRSMLSKRSSEHCVYSSYEEFLLKMSLLGILDNPEMLSRHMLSIHPDTKQYVIFLKSGKIVWLDAYGKKLERWKVLKIKGSAFTSIHSFKHLQLPPRLKIIRYGLCEGCLGLQTVTIPKSVTLIESYAFSRCENLKSITIPDSVTEIHSYAFNYCEQLKHVKLSQNLKRISELMFFRCRNLTELRLPESLEIIGNSAFYAAGLEHLWIPTTLTYIGQSAFSTPRPSKKLMNPEITLYNPNTGKEISAGRLYDYRKPAADADVRHFRELVDISMGTAF